MEAAVRALWMLGAARLIVAVPVASRDAVNRLERSADEVVCLVQPPWFRSVGQVVRRFRTDERRGSCAPVADTRARPARRARRASLAAAGRVTPPPWRESHPGAAAGARTRPRMSQDLPLVIRIDETSGTDEALPLDPTRLARGSPMPEQFARNLFSDPGGRFHTGIWRSSPGCLARELHGERALRADPRARASLRRSRPRMDVRGRRRVPCAVGFPGVVGNARSGTEALRDLRAGGSPGLRRGEP